MKSPLEQVHELEEVIRQLRKLNSLIYEGKECPANRLCGSILAFFEKTKTDLIKEEVEKAKKLEEEKS